MKKILSLGLLLGLLATTLMAHFKSIAPRGEGVAPQGQREGGRDGQHIAAGIPRSRRALPSRTGRAAQRIKPASSAGSTK